MMAQAVTAVSFRLIICSSTADLVSLVYMYLRLKMDTVLASCPYAARPLRADAQVDSPQPSCVIK